MSFLSQCLSSLGFTDISEVSTSSLRVAYRKAVLETHPDKGGSEEEFDKLLSAFVFLANNLNRIRGGRNEESEILSPDELLKLRGNEIMERFLEEFEREEFNAMFEKNHKTESHGYESWLRSSEEVATSDISDFESFHQEFQRRFVGEKEILAITPHLHEMSIIPSFGTELIESDIKYYGSPHGYNPEYSDLYSAYTKENIVIDKVPTRVIEKTLDDIIKEREEALKPITDEEAEAIKEYESSAFEKQKKHQESLKRYYGEESFVRRYIVSGETTGIDDTFIKEF
jgi:curved DNA-binding protein CbpA